MTTAKKEDGFLPGLAPLRLVLLLVVALCLPETCVWGFAITAPPAPGVFEAASPSSIGEITTASAYDAAGQRATESSLRGNISFAYNGVGEITGAAGLAGGSYSYDGIGNRLTDSSATYTPNALNQYSRISRPGVTLNPQYDDNGNLLADGAGEQRGLAWFIDIFWKAEKANITLALLGLVANTPAPVPAGLSRGQLAPR